jgi:hypothetical protein
MEPLLRDLGRFRLFQKSCSLKCNTKSRILNIALLRHILFLLGERGFISGNVLSLLLIAKLERHKRGTGCRVSFALVGQIFLQKGGRIGNILNDEVLTPNKAAFAGSLYERGITESFERAGLAADNVI